MFANILTLELLSDRTLLRIYDIIFGLRYGWNVEVGSCNLSVYDKDLILPP